MQTALALDTQPLSTSILNVAAKLADLLDGRGQSITRQILTELFANETGCSDASGHWSMRDAYTALELAQVLVVCGWKDMMDIGVPSKIKTIHDFGPFILDLFERLPSQGYRSESQIELQQFSTPLPLAWAAAGAAGITADDIVLEPSAGTGLLALRAHYMGAKLILNEIDELRRDCLAESYRGAAIHAIDGAEIDELLDPRIQPSVVLMNPPFARSMARGVDRHAATRHVASAFRRLRHGGRLVAILPHSWSADKLNLQTSEMTLLASIGISGGFLKHGTSVDTRLVVIDKSKRDIDPISADVDCFHALGACIDRIAPRESGISRHRAKPKATVRSAPLLGGLRKRMPVQPLTAAATARTEAVPLGYRVLQEPASVGDQVGIYLPYRPSRIEIDGATPHPTDLVESIAMGSVAAPDSLLQTANLESAC